MNKDKQKPMRERQEHDQADLLPSSLPLLSRNSLPFASPVTAVTAEQVALQHHRQPPLRLQQQARIQAAPFPATALPPHRSAPSSNSCRS
mmetsp:Transcript_42063/g.83019  ORF Transcript_42063/g.83019 Transcript_42063/m.83019 type:complete len:90 (+) Transcript_42063:969-1238(+)